MILYVKGDIFQSPAQVIVNTVNTVGVMGKGIALEFKRLFPEMFVEYRKLCETNRFDVGHLWLYKSPNKWVLSFPTKRHWRQPSRVEYIEAGLKKFVDSYSQMGIHSIAFPPIGCGNGQLDFKTQVQPLMETYLRNLPIETFIYPERNSDFVEHIDSREMKHWLRTEPQSLPFVEMWEDLQELLANQSTFETIAKQSSFTASIINDPLAIQIVTSSRKYIFPYEILMSFWQQLRTHGFSMRHIAPNLDRHVSYLIPIFSSLEYVSPVHVADKYDSLYTSSMIGLQVLPSAFSRHPSNNFVPEQLSLFE